MGYVKFRISFVFVVLMATSIISFGQNKFIIRGSVTDKATGEALVGTSIAVKNTTKGIVTDKAGKFLLEQTFDQDTITLVFSYLGFEKYEVNVTPGETKLEITLEPKSVLGNEVVVSASRISERILEAPITVESVGMKEIEESPKDYYSSLGYVKGVDIIDQGLLYKSINTRGFNGYGNTRLVQNVDGIDNVAPSLGFAIGSFFTPDELDIERMEIISGASSALYGANAFNGVVSIKTKDPFAFSGVSARLKTGVNHIDDPNRDPSMFNNVAFRYADNVGKFGYKFTVSYTKGTEWEANDQADINRFVPVSMRGPDDPGRDGVNIYGDEVATGLPIGPNGTSIMVSRTGYQDRDLIDYNVYSAKANAEIEYLLSDDSKLSYSFYYNTGTTSWQGVNKNSFKNIVGYQHKLEYQYKNLLLRAYQTSTSAGDAYDAVFLASHINRAWKSDEQWFTDYGSAYAGYIPGVTPGSFDAARAYADQGRLMPGTPEFEYVKDSVASIPNFQVGAKLVDNSDLYHLEGLYDFSKAISAFDLIVGASSRMYSLSSDGTFLADEKGEPITFSEYGMFAQATKKLLNDKLKLQFSGRYDKSQNFEGQFSPRFSAVYSVNENHFFRGSAQQGYRLPTGQDQFLDLDLGVVRFVGGLPQANEKYDVYEHSYTQESVLAFGNAVQDYIIAHGQQSYNEAVAKNQYLLERNPYGIVKPEKVKAYEIGYRGLYFKKKVFVDVDVWYNDYTDFLASAYVIKPRGDSIANLLNNNYDVFQLVSVNLQDKIDAYGTDLGLTMKTFGNYQVSANVSYAKSPEIKDPVYPTFKVPEWKTNVGLKNSNLYKNIGFSLQWRWYDTYSWDKTLPEANVPAANTFDAAVMYNYKPWSTTFKLGATNLTNNYYRSVYAGPSVGGLYYVSITYNNVGK